MELEWCGTPAGRDLMPENVRTCKENVREWVVIGIQEVSSHVLLFEKYCLRAPMTLEVEVP